jgi:hypothetical protein
MTPLAKTARSDVARELDGNLARSRPVAAEGAANRIENATLGDPNDVFGNIFVFQLGCIAGKCLRQRRVILPRLCHCRNCRRTYRQAGRGYLSQEMTARDDGH